MYSTNPFTVYANFTEHSTPVHESVTSSLVVTGRSPQVPWKPCALISTSVSCNVFQPASSRTTPHSVRNSVNDGRVIPSANNKNNPRCSSAFSDDCDYRRWLLRRVDSRYASAVTLSYKLHVWVDWLPRGSCMAGQSVAARGIA